MRPMIKVKLTDNAESWTAMHVLAEWRQGRESARNIVRAIRLYATLLKGDESLLREYFPYLLTGVNRPATNRAPANFGPPSVTLAEKTADEDEAELLGSIGLDGLKF